MVSVILWGFEVQHKARLSSDWVVVGRERSRHLVAVGGGSIRRRAEMRWSAGSGKSGVPSSDASVNSPAARPALRAPNRCCAKSCSTRRTFRQPPEIPARSSRNRAGGNSLGMRINLLSDFGVDPQRFDVAQAPDIRTGLGTEND